MLFKDIKPNYPVHIFDKQTLEYVQGKVIEVSFPHPQQLPQNVNNPYSSYTMSNAGSTIVVDVTIDAGGRTATYSIPENLSTTYAGNLVLSTECNGILKDIESMHRLADEALKNVERQREVKEKTSSLMEKLNPVYKEKKDTELRFKNIEDNVAELKNMLGGFIREFKN